VIPRLSLANLRIVPARYQPVVDPAARKTRMVHLGIGAFHRAHQAYYTERCGDWGIFGVTQRSNEVVEQLQPQDGLYTLVERGGGNTSIRVIGAVRSVMFAGDDPDAVIATMAEPDVSIVTSTVTERGYRYDPTTGRLRLDDPEIAADLAGRSPRTPVGQLAAAIALRAKRNGPPLTVVCCDNVPANGALLGSLVQTFIENAHHPSAVPAWMADNVAFPSTMVDRIVPSTTDADLQFVAAEIGVDDRGAVVSEPFSQWVIEREFAGPRPEWEVAGALLVDDVSPYERLKLRLLNGSHSALAYLGGLAGYPTIADAIADPELEQYVRRLMRDDALPTLAVPAGVDADAYQDTVVGRFANRALGHRTQQIATDGSHKLPQRLLGSILDRRRSGGEPVFAVLAVAAWLRHVLVGIDDAGKAFEPRDPMAAELRTQAAGATTGNDVVGRVIRLNGFFGELADDTWFRRTVAEFFDQLARHGVVPVVRELNARPG
jgi:fructuronate reductase